MEVPLCLSKPSGCQLLYLLAFLHADVHRKCQGGTCGSSQSATYVARTGTSTPAPGQRLTRQANRPATLHCLPAKTSPPARGPCQSPPRSNGRKFSSSHSKRSMASTAPPSHSELTLTDPMESERNLVLPPAPGFRAAWASPGSSAHASGTGSVGPR